MVTEDELTVKAVNLLQKRVTVHLNTQTCTHKTNSENIFLFVFLLPPICYFYEPKRPSHLPIIFFAEIKDPIDSCFGHLRTLYF